MKNGLMTRQEVALEKFAKAIVATETDGPRLLEILQAYERKAHKMAEDFCNGGIDSDQWDTLSDSLVRSICNTLGVDSVPGLFINGDARGYALKINNEDAKGLELIRASQLHTDWGGYGILAPEEE